MAGTIPLSLTQQLDQFGVPLAGGQLFLIEAGTVSTPQNGFQDSALTIPLPNPIVLDSSGRLPQFFLADGSIKIRLEDKNGVTQVTADGILVVGASSGGGGGSPVDPTTILATGDMKVVYGTGVLSGFVRANGRTIGSSTSGASERANADCQALFQYLWGADPNLVVPSGRGASASADWVANKQITLPDWRGRVLAGLDDMGNSAAGRLATSFSTNAIVLGAAAGTETDTLALTNLPSIPLSVSGTVSVTTPANSVQAPSSPASTNLSGGSSSVVTLNATTITSTGSNTLTGTGGGSATPVPVVQPTMLTTIYIKL
jgi:hypothetical protein